MIKSAEKDTGMQASLTPKKGDLLAAALVILLAAGLSAFLWIRGRDAGQATVEIRQDGEIVRELSLTTDQTFTLSGEYENTVTVQDGKIAITHSDCPGTDCVRSGWADQPGETIVCLPNRTEIRLVGTRAEDGVDAVAG